MVKQHEIQRDYADAKVAWDWAKRATSEDLPGYATTIRECHVDNIERVEKELARLNKIAKRHDQPGTVVLFSPTVYVNEYKTEELEDGERVYRTRKVTTCLMIVISPQVIGFGGWELLAVKTLVGGEGVIATLPGKTIPEEWRHTYQNGSGFCDHCQKDRRRNEVFIVYNDTTVGCAQVGRQCLREFMGIDPELPLATAAFYKATGEAHQGGRYEEDLDDYLPWVALAVRLDGRYWSKRAADEATSESYNREGGSYRMIQQRSTTDTVRVLQNTASLDKQAERPTDEDRAMAERVKAYVASLDAEMSGYHANLQAVYRSGIALWKHHGLIASAFAGYLREQERMAEEARVREQVRPSEWLGAQGDKVLRVPCRVTMLREIDGAYGTTYLYRFVTPEGDKITWFSSNDQDLEAGQELALSGTVKKLEEYRGEKQTVLTRCRIDR